MVNIRERIQEGYRLLAMGDPLSLIMAGQVFNSVMNRVKEIHDIAISYDKKDEKELGTPYWNEVYDLEFLLPVGYQTFIWAKGN